MLPRDHTSDGQLTLPALCPSDRDQRHCADAFPSTGLAAQRAAASAGAAARGVQGGGEAGVAIPKPRMLHGGREELADVVDVLFWSGGKDSFLALRQLAREAAGPASVLLLTTFDHRSEIVAHQEVGVDIVERQALSLGVALGALLFGDSDLCRLVAMKCVALGEADFPVY